jgi:hypothetical protein
MTTTHKKEWASLLIILVAVIAVGIYSHGFAGLSVQSHRLGSYIENQFSNVVAEIHHAPKVAPAAAPAAAKKD